MKKALFILTFFISSFSIAQMGEIWPVDSKQEHSVDANMKITKSYDPITVCQFFMFINNNEFIHVTDNVTSLYKIIKREYSADNDPIYTVVSEAGNTYTYLFSKKNKNVAAYSTQGYIITFACLTSHETKVFQNLNR